MSAISIKNVSKRYSNGVLAADGVSLEIASGEIFGLLGPNGAGKTTLLKLLTTLIFPTSGEIEVGGFKRPRYDHKIREIIGYVPQDISSDAALTGYENILISAKLHGIYGSKAVEVAENILKRIDLWEARNRIVRTYSGGMIRKLEIGQAMVHSPKILFLDEPTVGLDPSARKQVWAHIQKLHEEGITILMTTHYMEEADALCGRIAMMANGRIAVVDSPANLKKSVGQGCIVFKTAGKIPENIGVEDARVNGDSVTVYCCSPSEELPRYLRILENAGCSVSSVEIKETTLDDAFMKYVGRRMVEMEQWSATRRIRRVARRLE
ncbi:MAG: ATP-binding cassette domain-containing protein [Thermoplasmata archaeon]|nr:ATP-binding cassette domain-containing protein [Thermoplasmata archaeon]